MQMGCNIYFSSGQCKGADYTVQIIEKCGGDGRTERNAIDTNLEVIRRKTETEWILKLQTLYAYGINDRIDFMIMQVICEKVRTMRNLLLYCFQVYLSLLKDLIILDYRKTEKGISNTDFKAFIN